VKFSIGSDVLEIYPSTHVGLVVVKGCDNRSDSPETTFVLRESERVLRDRLGSAAILELPEIKKWRETYRSFGAKKGRRVSIEAMAKRVLKEEVMPQISPLVDLYNAVSLRYVFPCGGEDIDKLSGNVKLALAEGNENFFRIGGEENEPPQPGEVVYKDDLGCLCRCWNWREADRTKLTENTQNAVLVIETLEPNREKEFMHALKHLSELVKNLLGGQTEIHVLNRSNLSVEF